jgi:hypothetical protein
MKYQEALKIQWIYDFMNSYVKKNEYEIIKLDDVFHLKCSTLLGIKMETINEGIVGGGRQLRGGGRQGEEWRPDYDIMLNTCILFEEDGDPLAFFTNNGGLEGTILLNIEARGEGGRRTMGGEARGKCNLPFYQSLCLKKLMDKK